MTAGYSAIVLPPNTARVSLGARLTGIPATVMAASGMRVWPPITKFDDASAVYTDFPIVRSVAFAGLAVAGDAGRTI